MASDEITAAPEDENADAEGDAPEDVLICSQCGASETGFFCRGCGALLQGQDLVLCPRCHCVVTDAEFCNQCGQVLKGIALKLDQLALAGYDFMVTAEAPAPASDEALFGVPDDSLELEDAVLPDWLTELPKAEAPHQVRERIYPSLRPVEATERSIGEGRFLTTVVVLLALTLLGLVAFVVLLATRVL